jgi:hypothetical protein
MVGLARRRRPKLQAHSAVSPAGADLFEFDILFYRGGLRPQKSDADGAASLPSLFDRRCRATCTLGATPSFQIGRVGAPSPTQTSGAKRRLPGGRRSFRVRHIVLQRRPSAAKVGRRRPPARSLRPPARSLRLGERGIPTTSLRQALPRWARSPAPWCAPTRARPQPFPERRLARICS